MQISLPDVHTSITSSSLLGNSFGDSPTLYNQEVTAGSGVEGQPTYSTMRSSNVSGCAMHLLLFKPSSGWAARRVPAPTRAAGCDAGWERSLESRSESRLRGWPRCVWRPGMGVRTTCQIRQLDLGAAMPSAAAGSGRRSKHSRCLHHRSRKSSVGLIAIVVAVDRGADDGGSGSDFVPSYKLLMGSQHSKTVR